MACSICLEPFNQNDRRPKVLGCGHTYCRQCLERLQQKICPVDKKAFAGKVAELADNFYILQNLHTPAAPRFWCMSCNVEVTSKCAEQDHPVRIFKKVRVEESAPCMEALQQAEDTLATALGAVDTARKKLVENLLRELKRLRATRALLQAARGADAETWAKALRGADVDGVLQTVAPLAAHLRDPSAVCCVALRRGAGGDVACRGEVRPAEHADVGLLLCLLATGGHLQMEQGNPGEMFTAAQDWEEEGNGSLQPWLISNEVCRGLRVRSANKLGIVLKGGSKISRYVYDHPSVRYDSGGTESTSSLTAVLEPWELKSGSTPRAVDLLKASSSSNIQDKVTVLAGQDLNQALTLIGLDCRKAAPWCEQVLLKVSPHLESLQLLYPEQRHVVAALAMPRLHSLALVGVTKELLQQVLKKTTLRRLELHCKFAASLPASLPTFTRMGLQWLRCGLYPLRAALALAAANADTLEELELVADTDQPYGCPDLAKEIQRCDLKALKRMVLLRENAFGTCCGHSKSKCTPQKLQLWNMFVECGASVEVICFRCDISEAALT